jgi:dienelactone hydrolase
MELPLLSADQRAQLRRAEGRALGLWRRGRPPAGVEAREVELSSTVGYRLAARCFVPAGPGPWPAVVLCAEAGEGLDALCGYDVPLNAAEIAALGFAALALDPAGRGASWGDDDHGGPEHQDGAAVAHAWLCRLPGVDADRVGLLGYGAGSAAALGAASRRGARAAWVLDLEGPSDAETWTATGRPGGGDALWWADREPRGLLRGLPCGYVRLQAEDDHRAPGELRHALRMMHGAAAAGLPWFQINHHPRGEAPERPGWLPSGPLAARRALRERLLRLRGERAPLSGAAG